MRQILIFFQFFLGIVYRIDDCCMAFSAEMFAYPLQGPAEIFLGQKHQYLTRIGDLFFSGFGFQFLDGYSIILRDHIHEQIEILGSLGIGLDGGLRSVSGMFDLIA